MDCTTYARRLTNSCQNSFTFAEVGTKYVRLIVTDAAGRTATVEHNVVVAESAKAKEEKAKEVKDQEARVGLLPSGAKHLTEAGHSVQGDAPVELAAIIQSFVF